jgi:hypothetical protein
VSGAPHASEHWTGGCQCGAVRFSVSKLGRASLCHCRMCQKATGGIGGLYVVGHGITWTRGALKYFQSSNKVRRGFCADCGTPMTFDADGFNADLSIAAFDRAAEIAPVIQYSPETRLPWVDALPSVRAQTPEERAQIAPHYDGIVSFQHPDHETVGWRGRGKIEGAAP